MFKKRYMFVLILLITLTLSTVSASDLNTTDEMVGDELSTYDELGATFSNLGEVHTETSDGSKVIYDRTKPTVTFGTKSVTVRVMNIVETTKKSEAIGMYEVVSETLS